MGNLQFINLCKPPAFLILSRPGLRIKWYVFYKTTSEPVLSISLIKATFKVACFQTGIKVGVWILPRFVLIIPKRAFFSFAEILKEKFFFNIKF